MANKILFYWTPKDWALPLQIGFSIWKNFEGETHWMGHLHILFFFWKFRSWEFEEGDM